MGQRHGGRHPGVQAQVSPVETAQMLAFAARPGIKPMVETFPMAVADRALDHIRRGRAR